MPAATTIVVHPCDEPSLRSPTEAAEAGNILPILVGPAAEITSRRSQAQDRPAGVEGCPTLEQPL